jgi:hypothetical protein
MKTRKHFRKTRKTKKMKQLKTRKMKKMKKQYNKTTKRGGYLKLFQKKNIKSAEIIFTITIEKFVIKFSLHAAKHLDSFPEYDTQLKLAYDTDITMMDDNYTILMPAVFIPFIKQKLEIMKLTPEDFKHPVVHNNYPGIFLLTKEEISILYTNYSETASGNNNTTYNFKLVSICPHLAWEHSTWKTPTEPLFMPKYVQLLQRKNEIKEQIKILKNEPNSKKLQIQKLQINNERQNKKIAEFEDSIRNKKLFYDNQIKFLEECNAFFEELKTVENKDYTIFCKNEFDTILSNDTNIINKKFKKVSYLINGLNNMSNQNIPESVTQLKTKIPSIRDDTEKKSFYNNNIKIIQKLCNIYLPKPLKPPKQPKVSGKPASGQMTSMSPSVSSSVSPSVSSSVSSSMSSSQEEEKSSPDSEPENIKNITSVINKNTEKINEIQNAIDSDNNINNDKNKISNIINTIKETESQILQLKEDIKIIPEKIEELKSQINVVNEEILLLNNSA